MTSFLTRVGLAVTAGALAVSSASAQVPLPPVAVPPKVAQWPGGWMSFDGRETIIRSSAPGYGTTNIISGSGNGFGNKVVVGGGSGGGTTIIQNSRNGWNNRIVLDANDWVMDLDPWLLPPPLPPRPAILPQPLPQPVPAAVYEGKANTFWQVKAFSEELDCNIYWSATDRLWYRYHADSDKYKPLRDQPPAPKE